MVVIRKASRDDMNSFHSIRDEKLPKLHEDRLAMQDAGKAEYLIAFKNDEPVGHIFIVLQDDVPYHTCPLFQDLFVKRSEREKGVAKEILALAEKRLKEKGFSEVSIEVEENEEWIRVFYENVGFKLSSGPHRHSLVEKDTGKEVVFSVNFFKKAL